MRTEKLLVVAAMLAALASGCFQNALIVRPNRSSADLVRVFDGEAILLQRGDGAEKIHIAALPVLVGPSAPQPVDDVRLLKPPSESEAKFPPRALVARLLGTALPEGVQVFFAPLDSEEEDPKRYSEGYVDTRAPEDRIKVPVVEEGPLKSFLPRGRRTYQAQKVEVPRGQLIGLVPIGPSKEAATRLTGIGMQAQSLTAGTSLRIELILVEITETGRYKPLASEEVELLVVSRAPVAEAIVGLGLVTGFLLVTTWAGAQ